MNGGVVFLLILIFVIIPGAYGGWVLWSRMRAKRLGLAPPSLNPFNRSGSSGANYPAPAPGGIKGWFDAQIYKFKNRNNRTAAGAYEESSGYSGGRGRGAGHRLDPDEAWDARVGNEAYYEEQELGLHGPPAGGVGAGQNTGYGGGNAYGAPNVAYAAPEPERGRSRTREYDDGLQVDDRSTRNPFGDENAASLRGVSPRPLDVNLGQDTSYGGGHGGATAAAPKGQQKQGSHDDNSPTERRSMFRENV